jgi:RNA-binding protein YhbY
MVAGKIAKFQIGKNGVTEGVIDSLKLYFKTHKVVRISVLKSAVSERGKIKEIAEDVSGALEGKYSYSIVGYTIVLKKRGAGSKK